MIVVGQLEFNSIDEVEEYFEEQFFEIKKQLQSKPLLRATSKQRIKQLVDLQKFESILELSQQKATVLEVDYAGLSVEDAWSQFSSSINKWKLHCVNASTPTELLHLIELGFNIQQAFYLLIPELDWQEEDPKVGVVENVMHLQAGVQLMKSIGKIHFKELADLPFAEIKANEVLYYFFLELKRLSLRLQYV